MTKKRLWGLFDGKSSSRNGDQLVFEAPENGVWFTADAKTGEVQPDYALEGKLIAIICEDTEKFGQWTETALLVKNAPKMLELLREVTFDYISRLQSDVASKSNPRPEDNSESIQKALALLSEFEEKEASHD